MAMRSPYAPCFITGKYLRIQSAHNPKMTQSMSTFSESAGTALSLIVSLDPVLLAIVGRSLAVSATACALACLGGLLLGSWLGVSRFPGRHGILTVLNTLLAVPSVLVGLVVYLLLSRSGPLGFLGWLFSFKAMVLAQALLVLPVATALTRQVIEDAEDAHGEQLQSLGAGKFLRGLLLCWDERFALFTVLIACFGRAISEVGAVMIVGGNIDGFTRVMTTAIALESSKGDLPLAVALGLILLAVVLVLNMGISLLRGWQVVQSEAPLKAIQAGT
jgi:tungstate transport system permease protein